MTVEAVYGLRNVVRTGTREHNLMPLGDNGNMQTTAIPEEVTWELEQRNEALLTTDQKIHALEKQAVELRDQIQRLQAMKENILNDIALIERVRDSFVDAWRSQSPSTGEPSPTVQKAQLSPVALKVLGALEEAGKPVKGLELMEKTNLPQHTVGVTLRRLGEKGLAVNNNHRWSVP